MTTPITYAPVHQVPARIAMQTPALAQLREAFARIPNEILLGLVNSILTGLGVPKAQIENTDNAILEVETALGNLFSQSGNSINNWAMLLSGLGLGNITSLTAWLTNIQTASTDAWNQISDFIKTGDWEDLSHAWDDLMKILFGSATQTGYSVQIPFTAVGNVTQDLQPVGDFPDKFSVSGGSDWTWDGTVDHTEKPGSGSAKAVLSGGPAELLGVLTPVQPGQIVDLECYVKWSGLSNGVIKVFLTPDKGDVFTLSVPSPGASGDWTKLSGSYTIPEGVSTVQVSLYCSGTGSVWFDDCTATVTGGWLADLENDLTEIKDSFAPNGTAAQFNEGINNIIALFGLTSVLGTVDVSGVWTLIVNDIVKPLNLLATSEEMVAVQADLTHLQDDANAASEAFATLLQSWWETLTASGLSFSEMWDQLEDAWQTYVETNADITNDEWATLTDIFDKLLGIDPTTGLFPQSKISDLPALQSGYSALKDEVNAGNQAFATLLNSWYETLTNSSLTFAQKWSELENEWESYVTANSDIVANEWATLTDIFNAILGIDPSTGLIPQDKITGLEASGDNWDAAYANVQNFLTEWDWSDLSAAWTDLNNALWGGSTGTVGSTIQLGAIPSEIPQSKIDGLEAAGQNWDAAYDNLHNFLVTWDWTDLSHAWTDLNNALWGGSSGTVGATVQQSAIPSNIPQNKITGLPAIKSSLTALQNESNASSEAFATLLNSWYTTITTGGQSWSSMWNSLESAWATYVQTNSAIGSQEWASLTQLIQSIFGIDPSTGSIATSSIDGWTQEWNNFSAAVSGDTDDAGDWAWLGQIMNDWFGVTSDAHAKATSAENTLAIVTNAPVAKGLEDTVESNGDWHSASALEDVHPALGAFIRISQDKKIGFVQWIGYYSSTAPTWFYVNIYRFTQANGLEILHTSNNLSSAISNTMQWHIYDLPAEDAISVSAGDVLAVEFQSNGGAQNRSYTPAIDQDHPTATLKRGGFSRNLGSGQAGNVSYSSIPWSTVFPYVGVGVGSPDIPDPVFRPVSTAFTRSESFNTDSWAKYIDLVGLSGGGGGQGETGATQGRGGIGGNWCTKTLVVGSDIAAGGTITVTVGAGGSGGAYFADGSDGGATKFTWKNPSGQTKTLTAAGGHGGGLAHGSENALTWGMAVDPQTKSFAGQTYKGGGAQLNGAVGNIPGGGGSGGYAFQYGWAGARGQAWIVERQS